VIIELQKPGIVLDANYQLTITKQQGNEIQAGLPVSKLLRLAQDSNVLFILPLYKGGEALEA
jgi:hypothetical protein